MADSITIKFEKGGYERSLNSDEFAFEVTRDLRKISNDKHISIRSAPKDYIEDSIRHDNKIEALSPKQRKKYFKKSREEVKKHDEALNSDLLSFGEIKILPGNVGYLEILDFSGKSPDKKENKNIVSTSAVFYFLRNTNSIIIDLRENKGGYGKLAIMFCSFFSKKPKTYFITSEIINRYDSCGINIRDTFTIKDYTDSTIANNFTDQKALYILVSNRTFSSAELVAYKIKQFIPQTVIIGEPTQGGGNGFIGPYFNKYYQAIIPCIRSFDENNARFTIEGNGVIPDIVTIADSAFIIAYNLAIKTNDRNANQHTKYLKKRKIKIESSESEQDVDEFVGDYRKVQIYKDDKNLFMLYSLSKFLLISKEKDIFLSEEFKSIKFIRKNNVVVEIQITHQDGYIEKFRKR
jgi:C-terminal processing protease CtpA/Prc